MAILTTAADPRAGRTRERAPASATKSLAHYLTRPLLATGPLIFGASVCAMLVTAWLQRHEGYLTAESGIGYWLGIAGAVIMLLLLTYPLRKRFASFSRIGRVASWFRLHMVLGILGPMLVILHTNFKLGSLNSRLALFTMLVVVTSGIIGRYLYAKVHRGLYGQHAAMRDVLGDITALRAGLGQALGDDPSITEELEAFAPARERTASVLTGLWSCLTSAPRTQAARRRILRRARYLLRNDARMTASGCRRALRQIRRHLRIYFAAVRKAERLALFERIFGLWHHLHMPLFILLVLTVTLHIVAVHRY